MKKFFTMPIVQGILLMVLYLAVMVLSGMVSDATFLKLPIPHIEIAGIVFQLGCGVLLLVLLKKFLLQGRYDFGLRRSGFVLGFLVSLGVSPMLLINISLLITVPGSMAQTLPEFLNAFFDAMVYGLHEEVLLRVLFFGFMMMQWKDKKNGILRAVVVSSLVFGLLHLLNLLQEDAILINVLVQVLYATAAGCVFAAAFARSRCLWSIALMHYLVDFASFLDVGPISPFTTQDCWLLLGVSVFGIAVTLWALRKEKQPEILALWADTTPATLPPPAAPQAAQ